MIAPGVVESLKIVTEAASLRIARFAFELARRENRRRVTAVHKANIMKLSDGLFLECARRVARDFHDIEMNELIIDNCAMQLVMRPAQFDVLLLDNLYGDILSDLCAGLVGGLGVVPGANFGTDCAVFEAVHGSAPDLAGKRRANPSAVILSAAMLLHHLGELEASARLERAVYGTLADPALHPGSAATNSSPPQRQANAFPSRCAAMTRPVCAMTWAPKRWPHRSLTAFTPSRSITNSASASPRRRAWSRRCLSSASKRPTSGK